MLDIFLIPALQVAVGVIDLYKLTVIIRIVLSWLVNFGILNYSNPIVEAITNFIIRITEPALGWIRNKLPQTVFDISPMILIIGLIFLERVLINIMIRLSL